MRPFQIAAVALAFSSMNSAMAQERIRISSDWGNVTAELADNAAARSLIQMLPITIDMHDHLRQEKTGNLPSPLPEVPRQLDFAVGNLGTVGTGSLRDLLSQGPCPSAWDRDPRQRDRQCLDLRPSGSDYRSRSGREPVKRSGSRSDLAAQELRLRRDRGRIARTARAPSSLRELLNSRARLAPDACIAFNTRPANTAEAVERWVVSRFAA